MTTRADHNVHTKLAAGPELSVNWVLVRTPSSALQIITGCYHWLLSLVIITGVIRNAQSVVDLFRLH